MPGTVSSLTTITVEFTESVQGVGADDFLINGLALSMVSGQGDTWTFTFPEPPYGVVQISWSLESEITDFSEPANPFPATHPDSSWTYQLVDNTSPVVANRFPAIGSTVRALTQIEVTFSEEVEGVDESDLRVNGQAATNVTKVPGGPFVFSFAQPSPGTVTASWAPGHGITDISPARNTFVAVGWTFTLNPNATLGDLIISEFLAANVSTNGLADEDREQSDWIEIFNRSTNSVNLAGWSLSDDPDVPGMWAFPSRVLGPGQYLVVFASGKDRKAPTGTNRFHTSFQLGNMGEHLGLYSPDSPRVLVSGLDYPEQRNDHSYGYDTNSNLRYFRTPTPGAPNGASSISGVAEPVHFSVERGHFNAPFDLHLSTPTPKATIRVTLNGSEPTESNGFVYTNALRLSGHSMVRAAAFKANSLPSRTGTHTYLFNLPAGQRSLPIISVVTATNNLIGRTGIIGMNPPNPCGSLFVTNNPATDYHNPSAHGLAWERPVSAEYIRFDGEPGFQVDCGIRVQGSDYQRPRTCPTSKFSFRLYFRSDYGPGRLDYPLFTNTTVTSFDQLVLRAGFNDPSNPFIRDELTRRLSHDMGQVASHGNHVSLFVNGQYKGYYNPCERIHEEMLQSYHSGGEEWDVMSPRFATSASGLGIVDGDRQNFNGFVNFVNTQNTALQSVYQQVTQRLDIVNFVDYCLLNVYCGMGDWPDNNWRAGRERSTNGIWRFYIWDGEWAMGIYGRTVTRNTFAESGPGPDNSGLATPSSEIAQIYQRLRLNPEFRLVWADRIHKHFFNSGALMDRNITNHFFAMRAELSQQFSMATDILNPWVAQRRGIIFPHFQQYGLLRSSNAPNFSQFGGRVPRGYSLTMTANNLEAGTIYYTTNGVDPRVMFTATNVSPNALAYDPGRPPSLTRSVLIKARSLVGTNWSALTEANFEVGSLGVPLRITEINYNPPDGNAFEFIELQNVGAAAVDLTGMFFEGITFTFPQGTILAAGASLVLSSDVDTNAFAGRYPGVAVLGRFGGSLANGGERITLRDRNGFVVVSVDYSDEDGWPVAADGLGSSLEINDPFGDPDDPANWRASATLHGTPGQQTAPPAVPAVRINELMADNLTAVPNGGTYPDWIELYNAGGAPVDIGGWSLSDDGDPRKFIFPANTTIPAGDYLVVWCDSVTNTTPGLHTGFALGRNGETISLYNTLTSRIDAVTFGLQLPDYSIGRIGGDWLLTLPTPTTLNLVAPVGAASRLAINEWMANPLPGEPDWIELYNRTNLPVPLYGTYLSFGASVQPITSLSFVAANGFVQLFLDEEVGPDHLDLKLAASGGPVALYDASATGVSSITFGPQAEGVSQGRLPNGTGAITSFPGSSSPGASNYLANYTGPYLNEVMARNDSAVTNGLGEVSDWIELYNPATTNVDLGGMSLSLDEIEPAQWVFPPNTVIPAAGHLVIWCGDSRPASTNFETYLNTGRRLNGQSGGVYLFNTARQLVNSIEYGFQIPNQSIGRVGTQSNLLASPTPGTDNSVFAALGSPMSLVFNEWMTEPVSGPDWFEIFNTTNLPVNMGGLFLTDHPSTVAIARHRVAPLSFVPPRGWVQWIADGDTAAGRNHANFSLAAGGESLRLYTATSNMIHSVYFGAQPPGVSQGRLPDGAATIVMFPGSASPAESNYLLPENVLINEVLTQTSAPFEDAMELYNPGATAASIGGWYLSDDDVNLKKFRIPDGVSIGPGAYRVFYENQFNSPPIPFSLSGSRGNRLWLSQADAAGNLTGVRVPARFGAALNNISIGRFATTIGTDFVPLSQPTFGIGNPTSVSEFRTGTGSPNVYPKVGPVLISEFMYHPQDTVTLTNVLSNEDEEYVEVHNASAQMVSLGNWRLANAVNYSFAPGVMLSPGGFVLVVPFNPATDTQALADFRAQYNLDTSVLIFGPYTGRLANDADTLELQQPGAPENGFFPYATIEKIDYRDETPWPAAGTDGGGLSVQRKDPSLYCNEPINWIAANPSPGAPNHPPIVPLPVITASPQSQTNLATTTGSLTVTATGGLLSYQWRFNGANIPGATNAALVFAPFELDHDGIYDVFVSNPGGTVFSAPARLVITAPPTITLPPLDQVVRFGTNVTFVVAATGPGPLSFQWYYNGAPIPGETSRTLTLLSVELTDIGTYEIRVTNPNGTVSAAATLVVLQNPTILQQPQSVTALVGDNVMFNVVATGTQPMGYRWRRNGVNYVPVGTSTLIVTNVQLTNSGNVFTVVVTNRALFTPGVLSANAYLTVLADTDRDRMPDLWEDANGLSVTNAADALMDFDKDGMINLHEYVAGTDPNDELSYLKIDEIVPGQVGRSISFLALSNHNYTVQFQDRLGVGSWSNLAHALILLTNRVETITDSNAVPQRYYRLVTPFRP
ncbi:MAG: lamin tail domain-containing protein [Verrucomicrobia subdivision 3 bacterium]|nr:lamin tail domain-containing protein [Limisphaerales bacterium]